MIIVDASVFNKLFLKEPDEPQAVAFFLWAIGNEVELVGLELLRLEACQSALHYGLPFNVPLDLLEHYENAGMRQLRLRRAHWDKAETISRAGHPKSGYPQLTDSLYHAVALIEGGLFLTADRRHARKSADFGAVVLLEDWDSLKERF